MFEDTAFPWLYYDPFNISKYYGGQGMDLTFYKNIKKMPD